jgi:hypothetical protein
MRRSEAARDALKENRLFTPDRVRHPGNCGKHRSGLLGRQIQRQGWPDDESAEPNLSIIARLHRTNMLLCKELGALRPGYSYRQAHFLRVSQSGG